MCESTLRPTCKKHWLTCFHYPSVMRPACLHVSANLKANAATGKQILSMETMEFTLKSIIRDKAFSNIISNSNLSTPTGLIASRIMLAHLRTYTILLTKPPEQIHVHHIDPGMANPRTERGLKQFVNLVVAVCLWDILQPEKEDFIESVCNIKKISKKKAFKKVDILDREDQERVPKPKIKETCSLRIVPLVDLESCSPDRRAAITHLRDFLRLWRKVVSRFSSSDPKLAFWKPEALLEGIGYGCRYTAAYLRAAAHGAEMLARHGDGPHPMLSASILEDRFRNFEFLEKAMKEILPEEPIAAAFRVVAAQPVPNHMRGQHVMRTEAVEEEWPSVSNDVWKGMQKRANKLDSGNPPLTLAELLPAAGPSSTVYPDNPPKWTLLTDEMVLYNRGSRPITVTDARSLLEPSQAITPLVLFEAMM